MMIDATQLRELFKLYQKSSLANQLDLFHQVTQQISLFGSVTSEQELQTVNQLMVECATIEPVWGLQLGLIFWSSGRRQPHDFLNIWNCSRYAGISSRYSPWTAQQHQTNSQNCFGKGLINVTSPAPYIIQGNAFRQMHRYHEAESTYLQGLSTCVNNPFLLFRLIDLWLITYQFDRAVRLLHHLRSSYPYALEQMFAIPVSASIDSLTSKVFNSLDASATDMIWLVAADPVYVQRYGLRLVQGIVKLTQTPISSKIKLHVHVISDGATTVPMSELQLMSSLMPIHITHRTVNLEHSSLNQRKAIFASERFIVLHELLQTYNKPLLVTDIDVDPLQHPIKLFEQMGEGDIGYTRFGVVRDAWDLYPATALAFFPTQNAINFCKSLSAMIISLLNSHPNPWFVDQVALYRLIEGGLTPAKFIFLEHILNDSESSHAFFRILHGSWQ
jgi:hypothetical protein